MRPCGTSPPSPSDPDALEIEPLGGLTNRVFRISGAGAGAPFVLRLPGKGTEAYIDRVVEAHNARAAARAGVTPEILHVDPATGVLAIRHVEGRTMTPAGFASHPGAPAPRGGRAARPAPQRRDASASASSSSR